MTSSWSFYVRVFLAGFAYLTCVLWIAILPYNQGPDEYSHFDISRFIAQHGRYPVFGQDENMGVSVYEIPGVVLQQNASYAAMPPLAYMYNAVSLFLFADSPSGYIWVRLFQTLLIIPYTFIVWAVFGRLFSSLLVQTIGSLIMIFSPQIIFTFSYINSDAMLLLLSAVIWWWICYLQTGKHRFTPLMTFSLGISLGAAALTRYNILPAIALLGAVVVYQWQHSRLRMSQLVGVGVSALAVSGWWYLRNLLLYNDLLGMTQFWRTYYMLYPRTQSDSFLSIGTNSRWWWSTWKSTWGSFGWDLYHFPDAVYLILLGLCIGAVLRLVYTRRIAAKMLPMIAGLYAVTLGLSLWQSSQYAYQAQGRYTLPGFLFFGLLWAYFAHSLSQQSRVGLLAVTAVSLLGLQVWGLFGIVMLAFY